MRLKILVKSLKDCAYEMKYHAKMQGFFYNLLRDAGYDELHDKKGYKFFCFSNVHPVGEMKTGDMRDFYFSSPDEKLVRAVYAKLEELRQKNAPINIGEMFFSLERISAFTPRLRDGASIKSLTPITIRIPERNYDLYAVPPEQRKKGYAYWRPSIDFGAFVKQLNENLFKKYNEYYDTKIEEFPVFPMYRPIKDKPIAIHIIEEGREHIVVGTLWEFSFPYISAEQRKLLEFGIECGFGERNSLGFGFVDVMSIGRA